MSKCWGSFSCHCDPINKSLHNHIRFLNKSQLNIEIKNKVNKKCCQKAIPHRPFGRCFHALNQVFTGEKNVDLFGLDEDIFVKLNFILGSEFNLMNGTINFAHKFYSDKNEQYNFYIERKKEGCLTISFHYQIEHFEGDNDLLAIKNASLFVSNFNFPFENATTKTTVNNFDYKNEKKKTNLFHQKTTLTYDIDLPHQKELNEVFNINNNFDSILVSNQAVILFYRFWFAMNYYFCKNDTLHFDDAIYIFKTCFHKQTSRFLCIKSEKDKIKNIAEIVDFFDGRLSDDSKEILILNYKK